MSDELRDRDELQYVLRLTISDTLKSLGYPMEARQYIGEHLAPAIIQALGLPPAMTVPEIASALAVKAAVFAEPEHFYEWMVVSGSYPTGDYKRTPQKRHSAADAACNDLLARLRAAGDPT